MDIHIDNLSSQIDMIEGDVPLSETQLDTLARRVAERIQAMNGSEDSVDLAKLEPQSPSFRKLREF